MPSYSGTVTLAAGGAGSIFTFLTPFPVSQATHCIATPLGGSVNAPVYVTRGFGAAGVGTISINTTSALDAGRLVMVYVWNAGAEGL